MSRGAWLALIFTLGWLPLRLFRAEAVMQALPFYDRGERWWVRASIALLTLHLSVACLTLTLRQPPPLSRSVAGIVIFAAGIGFWLWGRMQIGPLRMPRLPGEPPRRLRRDGAFGLVRHPLYLGVLVAASAPVVTGGASLVVTFAFAAAAVVVRATQEERRLRAQLGPEYDAYCREVKRLIPFVW